MLYWVFFVPQSRSFLLRGSSIESLMCWVYPLPYDHFLVLFETKKSWFWRYKRTIYYEAMNMLSNRKRDGNGTVYLMTHTYIWRECGFRIRILVYFRLPGSGFEKYTNKESGVFVQLDPDLIPHPPPFLDEHFLCLIFLLLAKNNKNMFVFCQGCILYIHLHTKWYLN